MKLEEITEFWLDWGSDQQLTVHEGLSVATDVLKAGPLPVQIGTRSTTYMALGPEVPGPWLALFQAAVDPTAFQVDTTFTARAERGVLVQTLSLAPCERGEHLHASVTISRVVPIEATETVEDARSLLVESWREVGDALGEVPEAWFEPFVDIALDRQTLHGGE